MPLRQCIGQKILTFRLSQSFNFPGVLTVKNISKFFWIFKSQNFHKTKTEQPKLSEKSENSGLKVVSFGIPEKGPKILVNFDIFYLNKQPNWSKFQILGQVIDKFLTGIFGLFSKQSNFQFPKPRTKETGFFEIFEIFAKFDRTLKLLAECIVLVAINLMKWLIYCVYNVEDIINI